MYLTPAAVSYLTQIILVLAIFGFFVYHTLSQQRLGKTAHARFLLGFFAATTVFILLLFFETALLPAWRLQVVYLENATVGLILLLLLQFAYHFPHLPPHRKWEARLALGLSALYTLAEAGFALYRFAALRQGLVFFRPEWADYALVLGFLWVPVVFVRQAVYASRQEQANPGPGAGGRDLFGLAHLWQPQGQNARAARAFVLVYLLPVGMSLANLLRSYRLISAGLYHASLSVVLLFTLFLFAIAYLNSLPERTTFMVKLVGAALVTVLVVLGLVSWNIMPTYVSNYSVASPQGQTLNFSPNNSGGYTVTVAPFQFESELGSNLGLADALAETDSVALDFTFPFYGQTYRQVYVMNDGVVGLGRPVDHRTIQYHYGVSPAIFPLYLDLIPQAGEGGVYARRDADRLIITWDRVPAFRAQQTTYTFQLILHRDGTFQVSYNDIPPFLTFRPDSDPEDDIWLVGAVPGMGNPAQPGLERLLPQQVDFAGLPLTTGPQGVVFDYYLAFRRQLHQLFVPLAGLILASSVAILLGFPLFFHANLVMPLNALLRGVRRLEAGEYAVNVTVRYADEIGFLTDAFNKLAAQLGDLIRNLETHVVERTTALRASEARMRQITGAMRQAVWLRDTQTLEVLYVNPAYEEIWGRTCASLYADPTSFAQAIHPEDKERIFQAIQKQYQGIFFNEEYRIIRPDGSLRWVWGRTFPIENDQGKVYRVLAVVEDITRRKQMEAELIQARDAAEAANRAKSAFLANMSHELRTPLNAILGFAQLTVHNPSLPPEHRDNLHIITTSGEHLLTLINQVLDLSKIEAGKMSLEEKEFDLYRLLDDLEGLFQLRAADKSLRLMFDRAADVPQYIRTDEVKLRQVLINLLNNAVKFTQRGEVILRVGIRNQGSGIGGKIKKTKKEAGEVGLVQGAESLAEGDGIGNGTTDFGQTELPAGQHPESAHKPDTEDWPDAQRPDNQPIQKPTQKSKTSPLIPNAQPLIPDSQSLIPISFQIQDTGPGIAPAELDYLFEAFSQTQAGLQAREGTGLGLAISRRFVQLLGGEIWVESQVGQGATFTFTLPVGVAAGAEVLARAERLLRRVVGVAPGQPVYRLLIVDDRWDNRQFLVKLLAPFGFELQEAENGQQALEIWQAWQPHLIWLDIRMPVLDGWETTRRIKATPQGQKTVVVALTAGAFKEDRARVLAAGCDGFIRKPLREADIFETLERHLGLTFIYAEPPVEATPRSKAELVAALKTLPPDWLAALEKAIIVVDMERIDHLLAQIRGSRPALAHRLTKLADNFEFNRISALIEAAKKTE